MMFIYCEWWKEVLDWMRMGYCGLFEIGDPS